MGVSIDKLVQSLLQKDNLEQCSLGELQQFASQYPYFSTAQLLLAKKLKQENNGQYIEQLQKTSLFFPDQLWLEHLLNDTGNAEIIAPGITDIISIQPAIETTVEDTAAKEISSPDEVVTAPMVDIEKETSISPVETPVLKTEGPELSKSEFVFEPYHTVDYFASQGIKFREDEKPADKFGQQLKSFTDWLKTMKRLPASETAQVTTGAEQKVEQLAQHSIQDRDVITEAMAEVWEKQGNLNKAVDIYSKLSLLDPSKSAYFAAKIEQLKKLS